MTWLDWRGFGFQRFETGLMRVVAVHAETVHPLSVPFAGPFAVDAGLPVPEDGPVTLPAKVIGFLEADHLPAHEP